MKENIHSKKKTLYTDSNLHRYIIVPVEYILYGYQESELNHMTVNKSKNLANGESFEMTNKIFSTAKG